MLPESCSRNGIVIFLISLVHPADVHCTVSTVRWLGGAESRLKLPFALFILPLLMRRLAAVDGFTRAVLARPFDLVVEVKEGCLCFCGCPTQTNTFYGKSPATVTCLKYYRKKKKKSGEHNNGKLSPALIRY